MRLLKLVPWLFAITAVVAAAALLRVERLAAAEPPAIVERIREVARLEVLEVTVHRKVTFTPPSRPAATLLGDVFAYARDSVAPRRGKAIVFARARFFVDLRRLKSDQVQVREEEVSLVLPEPELETMLLPGETEVVSSNLDSAQTAELLEAAQGELSAALAADGPLRERAREAAGRSLTGLLKALGFKRVTIVQGNGLGTRTQLAAVGH